MPVPRVRFTVRRMMVAVAIVAAALAVGHTVASHWLIPAGPPVFLGTEVLPTSGDTIEIVSTYSTELSVWPRLIATGSTLAILGAICAIIERRQGRRKRTAVDPPEPE